MNDREKEKLESLSGDALLAYIEELELNAYKRGCTHTRKILFSMKYAEYDAGYDKGYYDALHPAEDGT